MYTDKGSTIGARRSIHGREGGHKTAEVHTDRVFGIFSDFAQRDYLCFIDLTSRAVGDTRGYPSLEP